MNLNLNYRIGYRAIKTSVAVFLCFVTTTVITHGNPFYAAIATVICIQQTHEKTLQMGVHRFFGTIIGGILGYLFIEIGGRIPGFFQVIYVFFVPLATLLAIYICNIFNLLASTSICCIVLLNIISNYERGASDTLYYAADRVFETTIGILIAVVVNRFLFQNVSIEDKTNAKQ